MRSEERPEAADRTRKCVGQRNKLAERGLTQLRAIEELWGPLRFLCPISLESDRDFCHLDKPLPLTDGTRDGCILP